MSDLLAVAATVLFFVISAAYVAGCVRLSPGDRHER